MTPLLKYLGYSAFGTNMSNGTNGNDNNTLSIPKEFKVDGTFEEEEQSALRAFYGITHYSTYTNANTSSDSGNYGFQTTSDSDAAQIVAPGASNATDPNDDTNWEWLNAYNAPHWVNVYDVLGIPTDEFGGLSTSGNFRDGTSNTMEIYSSSWSLDLLKAWEVSKPALVTQGLISDNTIIQLNGLSDPTYHWGHGAGGHSVGMGIDVGVYPGYISPEIQSDIDTTPATITGIGNWSIQNALDWTASPAYLPSVSDDNQQGALRNFLSLYAVTQSGTGNGTWSDLPLQHADRAALFGSGVPLDANGMSTQLIQNVWIGDAAYTDNNGYHPLDKNPFNQINAVLEKLGFVGANGLHHGQQNRHETHFHVDLHALTRVGLPQNLLTGDAATTQVGNNIIANAQAWLDQVKADLNLTQGEVTMFIPDIPNVPPQNVPVMIAQANQTQAGDQQARGRALGICRPVPSNYYGGENTLSPLVAVKNYFRLYDPQTTFTGTATLTVLQQPKHGVLRLVTEADRGVLFDSSASKISEGHYVYLPEKGYLGDDKASFLVEREGIKIKVVYFFKAVNGPLGNSGGDEYCEKTGIRWKISSTLDADGNSTITSVEYQSPIIDAGATTTDTAALAATLSTSILSTLSVDPSTVTFNLADLAGGAVGQTVGTAITLDDNAAGHNWFIDTTPWDNSEYLPTSNPYEWVAKEGTVAYGKMDMLSVLLHEYGHTLGIEHSADHHDYMATTLTPGVRRMPSAEEMALMQQLVAQAKDGLVGRVTPADSTPDNTPKPFPTLPFGTTLSLAFLGRLRSSRYGDLSIAPDYATLTTKYAVAANATFANLNTPAGWNTQGSVDIAPSTGSGPTSSATLNEVSTSQTRLSQVFMLNEQDRYLSFTLSGAALDDLNGAPDDAFEVALLDANTGLSVLGSNGLTRSDAFLNLQGDGTQHAAQSVTRIDNADGSRTYRVDLSGVAKNTAVNLSFDLLGFGQDNSHVTLSDIRVSGLPQLHDDAASLPEDNLLTFDPFAQADSQLKPLLDAHIVATPMHGSLAVNADGTFAYTPDLDYFGTDSFSYRLSDGPLDSNLAIVSLTVTAVNDAPVVADVQVTTAEDTAVVIALGAYATDVDFPSTTGGGAGEGALATLIVTGPAHGVLTQNADGSYTYTPDANYNGEDSFTYKVNDGELDSNIATVSLNIGSVNDAPQGADATVTTLEDTPYVFQLADFGYSDAQDALGAQASRLLADETPALQGNNFAAVIIGDLPVAGSLTLNGAAVTAGQRITAADIAAGLLQLAPSSNANGAAYASFTFQVQDDGGTANGGADTDQTARTMTLDITAVNDAPVAADTQAATDEDTPLMLDLLAAASDVDGDVLMPVIIAGPLHGQLIQNADGTFTYLSDPDYSGTDSFTYQVSESDGTTSV